MNNISFTVGPTQLYPTVPGHVSAAVDTGIPTMSHRGSRFAALYDHTKQNLRELLGVPADYHIWFMGSATEAMERSIQNTVEAHSHHVITGAFGRKFADQARGLGKTVTLTETEWGSVPDLADIAVPAAAELICLVQNDTSSGTRIEPAAIAALHERYPDKLLAVDIVSSAPYATFDIAAADLVLFSVQKGFGLPSGLGVLIASPRAFGRANKLQEAGLAIGNFHSFPELGRFAAKGQTPETPNILGIYLLNAVTQDLLSYGLDRMRTELDAQAGTIYDYFDRHPDYTPAVTRPEHRSATTIVIEAHSGSRSVLDSLSAKGAYLGTGYGAQSDTHLRIANFPAHIGHTSNLLNLFDEHHGRPPKA